MSEKKKLRSSPEIMVPTERGRMDKALSGMVNSGESAEDALRRIYRLKSLQDMTDSQIYKLQDKTSDLLGHLALEKHGISDADPKAVQKALSKEYGYFTDNTPAIIAEQDPAKFMKKFQKAQELGYVNSSSADELMFGDDAGQSIPFTDSKDKIAGQKAILLSPNKGILNQVGVAYHEAPHGINDLMGYGDEYKEYDWDLANVRKNSNDPMDALKSITKGHHVGDDHYEIDKMNQILQGGEDYDDNIKKHIKTKSLENLNSRFGDGYKKVRGVSSPLGLLTSLLDEYRRPEELAKANPVAQSKIAAAYEAMQHSPDDPAVRRAYDALSDETSQQFEELQKKGLKISKITGENPYKSSADLIKDVKDNNHMSYYPTESGYGNGDAVQDHPLLKASKHLDVDGKPMPVNDLFRVVHDYQGHVEGGNKFGPTGEERAFQQHSKMFSPEAQKALASETRGQNSWVNFGPDGEANRANPANTKYAEQKAGLLPTEFIKNTLDDIENPTLGKIRKLSSWTTKTIGPLGIAAAIAPVAADLKEGKPNTALARVAAYGAPFGSEEITDRLMADAKLQDTAPELSDPSYMQTLKNIGNRRRNEGKSPIVESFSGQKVDTSATEMSDIENKIKALQRIKSGT